MKRTQYLFSYGTLQDKTVQKEIFGRELSGKRDVLIGYCISRKKVMGKYPVVEATGSISDTVAGAAFKVTYLELHWADRYETAAYKRISAPLKSGKQAWIYVEDSG